MDSDDPQKKILEFRKVMSDYRKTSRIVECFFHDKTQCKGDIKQSHSLQKNGRLSIIEGFVNKNKVVYTFTEAEFDQSTPFKTLKPIGKSGASTFFGFCDYHDTILFSEIENKPFDESDEHCFLHSYRSFAHTYHRKKEEHKAYSTKSKFTDKLSQEFLKESIKGLEIGLKDGDFFKKKLDRMIENKAYNELEYLTYILPERFPIACSSQISPLYSYSGKSLNNHTNPDKPYSSIMLTVLPDIEQTIIILACFPDDPDAINFLDELDDLYPLQFEKAISSILINCAENTFFAPALWDALGKQGQAILCQELAKSASPFSMPEDFEISRVNFFNKKYAAKSLKLV